MNSLLYKNIDLIYIIFVIFFVVYGVIDIKLPTFIQELFDNLIFRVIILGLIAFLCNSNNQLSLFIALSFTLIMNILLKQKQKERFKQKNYS